MKIFNLTLTLITILFFTALAATNVKAQTAVGGRLITVTDNGDSNDVNAGDGICLDSNGNCTLRAAIQESNGLGFNVINFALPPDSVINLTLGELLITKVIHIVGPGARKLTIQRSANPDTPPFRIFHIAPNVGLRLIIRGFKIKNGNVDSDGGGFYIEKGNIVYMTDVAVSNNSANRGGGIANAGTVNLTRSLINSNVALILNGAGGGIMNIDGGSAATISNSTLTENSAVNGGAIYNEGNLLLVNNTITNNSATNSGSSVVSAEGGVLNVLNTIIGMDTASTISSLSGTFNSLGNNLITDARNSTGFTNGVNNDQVSNNNTINPMLGNLSNNGGQTDTRALQPGSPAIDRGNNCIITAICSAPLPPGFRLSTDQRTNSTRLSGQAVDVGAYETGSSVINGSIGFGRFSFRPRLAGSLVILTDASTGEKRVRTTNPFGNFVFSNLPLGEVFILEIRSKRAGQSSVAIFDFDNLPIPQLGNSYNLTEDLKIIVDK